MEKFRLGLVGCGNMMIQHLRGADKLNEIEFTAVSDVVEANAKEAAEVLGGKPKIYADYHDMLDDVDGVMVALPHDLHFECGMFFALNKKHILMEKPLCNTEEECVKLIETCDNMGVTLMCAYPVPFLPGIKKLKELIDSGDYGATFQMSIWTEQLTGIEYSYEKGPATWSITARLGGGQLFSHGCHYIDLLLRFLGNPVSGSHLGTNLGTPWMLKEGTSSVIMKFESGCVAYHGATWGARGTRLGYDYQIHTEKGLLNYVSGDNEIRFYANSKIHVPGVSDEANDEYEVLWKEPSIGKGTFHEIRHFVECVREGKEPITSGKSSLQSLRVIWKMYDAEKQGVVADLRGLGLEDAMK